MNIYMEEIEKMAGMKEKAINTAKKIVRNNKKKIIGAGIGAAGLGTAYGLANDKQKQVIKDGVKFTKNGLVSGGINGYLQDASRYTGGAIGTALAMKRGKSLPKALAGGGMAGLAIGDIAGAATIPTVQLYNKHKKEFGKAPDAKSLATVMGANLGPTAGIWGALYGAKKGIKLRKNISSKLVSGAEEVIGGSKGIKNTFRKAHGYSGPEGEFTRKAFKKAKGKEREVMDMARDLNQADFANKYTSQEDLNNLLIGDAKKVQKGVLSAAKAFAPVAIADQIAGIPAAMAAPQNVIDVKKKIIERKANKESNQES